jgi:thermitase
MLKAAIFLPIFFILLLCFANLIYAAMVDGQAKHDETPQYVPGEVLVKFKEGADPNSILKDIKLEPKNISRIHSITPAAARFKKDYRLKKDAEGWYPFLGKKYKEVNDIPDEELFKEAYKNMPETEKALYRSYKIKLPAGTGVDEAVSKLKSNPDVEYAEPNYISRALYVPDDPLYPRQWAHKKTQAEAGWDMTRGDPDIVIAIVDTGVDYTHEDLAANIWKDIDGHLGRDFVDIDTAAYVREGYELIKSEDYTDVDDEPLDYYGHGTHCAGIAAAVSGNGIGIAGTAGNCRLMPVRAGFAIKYGGNIYGSFEYDDIFNAVVYAADNGADVISMSFGGPDSQTIKDAIDYAYSSGVVLVAAAGNDASNAKKHPAGYGNVIAVGATAQDDSRAYYSNYGYWIDICAPGGDYYKDTMILSCVPKAGVLSDPSGYKTLQGTSMACPYVAGTVGLILSRHPDFSKEEVRAILRATADDIGAEGVDEYAGYGRVNIARALTVDTPCAVYISSPVSNTRLYKPGIIQICGMADGRSFNGYTLEVGRGYGVVSWETIASGTTPVHDGVLANWDVSSIGDEYVILRLTAYDKAGNIFRTFCKLTVFRNLHEGWPLRFGLIKSITKPAAFADMDGDYLEDLVICDMEGKVNVLRHDGLAIQGWPLEFPGRMINDIAAGNMDEDINNEIALIVSDCINIFDESGKNIPGWPQLIPRGGYRNMLGGAPTLVDLDLDGINEIVAGCSTLGDVNFLYVFKPDGQIAAGWPQVLSYGRGMPYTAAADFNADGKPEIAVILSAGNSADTQTTCLIYNAKGEMLEGWPVRLLPGEGANNFYFVVGDITGDGRPEIIFVTSRYDGEFHKRIHAIQHDGTYPPGWPLDADFLFPDKNGILVGAVLGDINNDRAPEIIVSLDHGDGVSSKIAVFGPDGNLLPGWPVAFNRGNMALCLVADIDGDKQGDIIAHSKDYVYALNGGGQMISGWPKPIEGYGTKSPALGDIDGDSKLELLAGGGLETELYVYDLDAALDHRTLQWPMYLHDSQRSGRYRLPPDIISPARLTAAAISSSEIKLEWQDKSDNETGFRIERSASAFGAYNTIAEAEANATLYVDSGLKGNTAYYYRISAFNETGQSDCSDISTATTLPSIAAPSNLNAAAISGGQINLTWQDNSDNETFFSIERGLSDAGPFAEIASVTADTTTYSNAGLDAGTTYYYRIRAGNASEYSYYSTTASATTPQPPAAPTELMVYQILGERGTLHLNWKDNALNEDGFKIQRSLTRQDDDFTQIADIGPNAAPSAPGYADTGLSSGKKYYYRVCAYNIAGNSAWSNISSATTPVNHPPAIMIDPAGDKTIDENQPLVFTITISDPDFIDNPQLLPITLPDGATLTPQKTRLPGQKNILFAWTPSSAQSGIYPLTFTASDGELTASISVTITVNDVSVISIELEPMTWLLEGAGLRKRIPNKDASGNVIHHFTNTGTVAVDVEIGYVGYENCRPDIRPGLDRFMTTIGYMEDLQPIIQPAGYIMIAHRLEPGKSAALCLFYYSPLALSKNVKGMRATYGLRAYAARK